MNDFPLPQFAEGPWELMCRRLEPLLGNVPQQLGSNWFVTLERLFSKADLDVAIVLCDSTHPRPDWFVIRYTEVGRDLDDWETGIACAPSQLEAIASLLTACESRRIMPTKVAYGPAQRDLQLFVGNNLLGTVAPLVVKQIPAKLRDRTRGTLSSLRSARNPTADLLKRLRKWPHLTQMQLDEELDTASVFDRLERMMHLPHPKEWLLSARMLCAACSSVEADTAFVEKVASAALNASSWNHLAGSFEVRNAGLMQPWSVHGEINDHSEVFGYYADGLDAFADAVMRLPHEFAAGWKSIFLKNMPSFSITDELPTYGFLEKPLEDNRSPNDPGGSSIWVSPIVRVEKPEPNVVERIERALSAGSEAIARLFGVGFSGDVRARVMDERSGETLIVQDGAWRVTRNGDPGEVGTHLCVYQVDENSNAISATAVPTYKGLLQTHRRTGHHVLCADYDGRRPVAVLKGLSPTAVALIRENLPSTSERVMEFVEERRWGEDRLAFAKIMGALSS